MSMPNSPGGHSLQGPRHATGTLVGGGGCQRVCSSAASRVASGIGPHTSNYHDMVQRLGQSLAYLRSQQR